MNDKPKRTDTDCINESLANGLLVIEALEGLQFETVKITRIASRTGLSYDFCMRALRTLRWKGYAEETLGGWRSTGKFEALMRRAADAENEFALTNLSTQTPQNN